MLNILVNAYSVSPTWGSEPGMGWNWIVHIAKYCNMFIITEGEWKNDIEEALKKLPQRDNLHFYYNPVPQKVRDICWNQGDWRFYWYYRKWQKKTYKIALDIISQHHIDVIHQLNMIGFREPGYLWKIKDIPYVWGPIGGTGSVPLSFIKDESFKRKLKITLKNNLNKWQLKYYPRVVKAVKRSNKIIAAVKEAKIRVKLYHDKDAVLINETGTSFKNVPIRKPQNEGIFRILWVGRFIKTKQLDLALKSIAAANLSNYEFHVCGCDINGSIAYYEQIAKDLGINEHCIWHGKVNHELIQDMMSKSDLFFFTSILEATSTVVLESISSGLPILSFNICGFGPLVSKFAGVTIELSDPDKSVSEFSAKLKQLENDRTILDEISKNEISQRECLSWETKAKKLYEIYQSVCTQ